MSNEKEMTMKHYRFHWLDGTVSYADGYTVSEAFQRLGFGAGAVHALDYWEEVLKGDVK